MTIGSTRPMEDAARIAYRELIRWLVSDYGFDQYEAYFLLTQAGRIRLGNMVDPKYTPRRFNPEVVPVGHCYENLAARNLEPQLWLTPRSRLATSGTVIKTRHAAIRTASGVKCLVPAFAGAG